MRIIWRTVGSRIAKGDNVKEEEPGRDYHMLSPNVCHFMKVDEQQCSTVGKRIVRNMKNDT